MKPIKSPAKVKPGQLPTISSDGVRQIISRDFKSAKIALPVIGQITTDRNTATIEVVIAGASRTVVLSDRDLVNHSTKRVNKLMNARAAPRKAAP